MASEDHLRILQVIPALSAGGAERTTLEVAQAVICAGGRALVATSGGRLEQELILAGGEIAHLPAHSKNPATIAANAGRLARLARRERMHLIHARSRAPGWSALWASRRLKTPFVTTYHGIYNGRTAPKRFYNSVMARGDMVIANSEYTRRHILDTYPVDPGQVVTIPRGADLVRFNPETVSPDRVARLRALWGVCEREGAMTLLAPARLTRWKGQALLLQAAAKAGANLQVVLAGDAQGRDEYLAELAAMIESLGLGRRARIVGHVDDMPAAFLAADVAVMPSTDPEAFGRASVEAQAMGRPVIAAAHGGLAETVVEGETGLLVPPRDVEALAEAVRRLQQAGPDRRAAMGAAAKARARQLYSSAALQRATLDVYRRLLQDKS
jgi:glycosyltransferase involved in cell wall biosynthesis